MFQSLVFLLLVANVTPDDLLVASHCGHEVAACPEMLADEVALALSICPCQVNGTLTLDSSFGKLFIA